MPVAITISGWNPKTWRNRLPSFFWALLASVLIHLVAIFWHLITLPTSPISFQQLHFQARLNSLRAPPPTVPAATRESPRPPPNAKSSREIAEKPPRQLAQEAPSPNTVKVAKDASKKLPDEQKSEPPSTPAIRVEGPAAPIYPEEAIARGLESCVLAAIDVKENGEVSRVTIVQADVPNIFDQAVIDSQMQAHYLPARNSEKNVPSTVLAVIGFTLNPGNDFNCPLRYAATAARLNGQVNLGPK